MSVRKNKFVIWMTTTNNKAAFWNLISFLCTDTTRKRDYLTLLSSKEISFSSSYLPIQYFFFFPENYHWWWRSFFVSGGSAIYVLAYSVFYFYTKLDIDEFVPTLLYFTYTLMMVVTFWLLTGTIGFYAAFFFIRKIYAAVKIDWRSKHSTTTDLPLKSWEFFTE